MKEVAFDRFYVEKEDFDLYKKLEEDEEFPLNNHHEVFILSVCIGYKYNLREKLSEPKPLTGKLPILNLDYGQAIYDAFKCIAKLNNDVDENGNLQVNLLMEEYAKGGFNKLYNEILSEPSNKSDNLLNHMLLNLEL